MKKIQLTKEDMYQVLCDRHTKEIQDRFAAGKVAIAGLGGLGSSIAIALARIGVGHLHLIDFDQVDPSNLNRQQYKIKHLGMAKTEALKMEIEEIHPYLELRIDTIKVTKDNIKELFEADDIVCEAFDLADQKAMLVNGILEHYPEKKLVSASGMAGYESSNLIKTRKVMDNFYLCGDEINESIPGGRGLMAPRVSICAGHEANMIARLLIGIQDV